MIAFDTNILTEILSGNTAFVNRASKIASLQQSVPIIVVEEIMRGRLNIIRRCEAGKSNTSLEHAYQLFQDTFYVLRKVHILPYSSNAESLYRQWKKQGIRVHTHDLRIAAICVAYDTKLITRNKKDFISVPDLNVEFW